MLSSVVQQCSAVQVLAQFSAVAPVFGRPWAEWTPISVQNSAAIYYTAKVTLQDSAEQHSTVIIYSRVQSNTVECSSVQCGSAV